MSATKIKIAIVDDAAFIVDMLKDTLNNERMCVVAHAQSGEEAETQILKEKPHVVLMDLALPSKNGVEVTKELLKVLPTLKVIAMSGLDDPSFVTSAMTAGCCGFLKKPFTEDMLFNEIEKSMKDNPRE